MKIRAKIERLKDGYSFLHIHPRIGVMYRALKKPGKNGRMDRIQCAYFGFEDEAQAKNWLTLIKQRLQKGGKQIFGSVREAERLTSCAFEVKVAEYENIMALVLTTAKNVLDEVSA